MVTNRGQSPIERWFQHVLQSVSAAAIIGIAIMIYQMRGDVDKLIWRMDLAAERLSDVEQRLRVEERKSRGFIPPNSNP